MSLICKSCGAPASNSTNLLSFVCGYCGSKNVDPDYLKQYASKIDLAKASHNFQLAMVSINGGDYTTAEKHLEASVLEDANNSEPWIYLALSRAALIKPSNYSKLFESSIQCLNKAKLIDPDSEVYSNGSLLVQTKLLETSIVGASYYIETAYKKYTAYSGTSGATLSAAEEAQKGFRLIGNAHKLSINNNELSAKALAYAIANCIMFKKEVGPTHLIDDQYRAFLGDLNAIYQKRKDLVLGELASYPNQKADIQKALEKLNPIAKQAGSAEGPSSENTNPSGTGVNKNFLVIVAGLVIVIVSYFAFGGRKESDSITTATPQQSSATASIPKIETPSTDATIQASAANTVNTSEQASPSTLNPRSEPQSNEVSAQSNEANQQNAGLSCSSIEDCIRRSLFAANLEDVESIRKIATAIDQLPKPDLGNKQVSRKLNAQGLESLRRGDFEEAVNTLKLALKENPKDVEISSNLGFSLVKAGRYKEAISVLNGSLVLDPRRTSTWTPLAEAYALDNKPNEAVASIWVALQWSADRDKSIAYYADRIEKERGERQQLFDLYRAILNWSNGSKPDIRL